MGHVDEKQITKSAGKIRSSGGKCHRENRTGNWVRVWVGIWVRQLHGVIRKICLEEEFELRHELQERFWHGKIGVEM